MLAWSHAWWMCSERYVKVVSHYLKKKKELFFFLKKNYIYILFIMLFLPYVGRLQDPEGGSLGCDQLHQWRHHRASYLPCSG